jgi:uncharacterized protein
MSNYDFNQTSYLDNVQQYNTLAGKKFLTGVFTWMFVALSITAITAYAFNVSSTLQNILFSLGGFLKVIMFLPLAFVLVLSFGFNRMSAGVMAGVFLLYSIVNGVVFSFILAMYTGESVVLCFAGAAIVFGLMAVMGYTTDKDLTKMGSLLMVGLIAVVIISIINFFMNSSAMSYLLSIATVIIFTGLTAYDVQKLKNIGMGIDADGETALVGTRQKLILYGALSLYLDFINIFLSLLRLFGRRN